MYLNIIHKRTHISISGYLLIYLWILIFSVFTHALCAYGFLALWSTNMIPALGYCSKVALFSCVGIYMHSRKLCYSIQVHVSYWWISCTVDSGMVVASYRKDVDFVLVHCLGSLHRNSVDRLTKEQHTKNKTTQKKKNKIIFMFYRPSCSVMNAWLYNNRAITHWLWAGFFRLHVEKMYFSI